MGLTPKLKRKVSKAVERQKPPEPKPDIPHPAASGAHNYKKALIDDDLHPRLKQFFREADQMLNKNPQQKPAQPSKLAVNYKAHRYQQRVHNSKARFRTVFAGSRGGKTTLASFEVLQCSLANPEHLYWVVAPTYKLLRVIERDVMKLLRPIWKRVVSDHKKGDKTIIFKNGTILEFRSADDPDSLRAAGVNGIVVDEAAFIKTEAAQILRTRVSDKLGWILAISTPKGRNWVYRWFLRGKDPSFTNYQSFHWRSVDNPYFPNEEYENAKQELPADFVAQEFDAEVIDDVGCAFKNLDKIMLPQGKITSRGPFTLGTDLGKHIDYTVLTIMGIDGKVIDWTRINKASWVDHKKLIIKLAEKWNAVICMDITGVGDPIYDELLEVFPADRFVPVTFSTPMNRRLILSLQSAIEHIHIKIPSNNILLDELKLFEFIRLPSGNIRYGAPKGFHCDAVWSLALANWGRLHNPQVRAPVFVDIEPEAPSKSPGEAFFLNTQRKRKVWQGGGRVRKLFGA